MIYKIRIILNTKEDVFRDVEIKATQSLYHLHLGIKSAFSLLGEELSSFYYSDNDWNQGEEIPLEDMTDDQTGEIMSDIYVKEALPKVGSKLLYVYDFMVMWSFCIEVLEIQDKVATLNYPLTVFRFGKMPLKAPDKKFTSTIMPSFDLDLDEEIGFGGEELLGFETHFGNAEEEEEEEYDTFNEDSYDEEDIL